MAQYKFLNNAEDEFHRPKSKELSLSRGDENTSSFHVALNHKNYGQAIKFMKNIEGHLIYSQDCIRDILIFFFSILRELKVFFSDL